MGDWINLTGHQKAACQIIIELFTPETAMSCDVKRKIMTWYIRFDIFVGFMSGAETVLDRVWHAACADYYFRRARERPDDFDCLVEDKFACLRLLGTDIALMLAKKQRGVSSDLEFMHEMQAMGKRVAAIDQDLKEACANATYVTDFGHPLAHSAASSASSPQSPGSGRSGGGNKDDDVDDVDYGYVEDTTVMNSTDPHFVMAGDMFVFNFIRIDFWAISLMYKLTAAQFDPALGRDVGELAFRVGKMFEALQFCAGRDSKAMILAAQASLGMAAVCLPKDRRHTMWCRRKYAAIDFCG